MRQYPHCGATRISSPRATRSWLSIRWSAGSCACSSAKLGFRGPQPSACSGARHAEPCATTTPITFPGATTWRRSARSNFRSFCRKPRRISSPATTSGQPRLRPIIRRVEGGVELARMRWGFPPGRPKAGPVINFRSEGRRFERGRCLGSGLVVLRIPRCQGPEGKMEVHENRRGVVLFRRDCGGPQARPGLKHSPC